MFCVCCVLGSNVGQTGERGGGLVWQEGAQCPRRGGMGSGWGQCDPLEF